MNSTDVLNDLKFRAERENKPTPTLAQIDEILITKDFDGLCQAFQNRFTMVEWDKTSNINEATPNYILENNPWADVIYLLLYDGVITYLQSHIPFVEGYQPITNENLKEVSDNHILEIAKDAAFNQIVNEIWVALGN